jgi:peptidoglycan/LPS O-acetylase OafA/YrhL
MVFFVLSGFLISSSIVRKMERGTWTWSDYALDRSTRLYLVLIPGLILGGMWDLSGRRISHHLYDSPLFPFGTHVSSASLNVHTLVGNALFLQTRWVEVFGSNGPLWSLFNEGWYYVLFPALVCGVLSLLRRQFVRSAFWIVLAGAIAWLLSAAMWGFVVWLSGFAVAIAANSWRLRRRNLKAICLAISAALFAVCAAGGSTLSSFVVNDLCVGLSFALFLYAVLQLRVDPGVRALKCAKLFSGFSYTLYLVHFPFLLFIRASIFPHAVWQPDARHILGGCMMLPVVLLYAFGVSQFTERKTADVRDWLRRKLLPEVSVR